MMVQQNQLSPPELAERLPGRIQKRLQDHGRYCRRLRVAFLSIKRRTCGIKHQRRVKKIF